MVNQGATTSTKAPESVPPTATTTTPTPTPTPTTALTPTRESLPPELAALHLQSDTQSAGVRTEIYTTKEANQQITILSATTAFPPPNATAETLQLGTLELSLATLADDKFQATFTFEGTYYSARSESLAKAAFTTFLAWYLDQATPQVTSPTSSS